MKLRLCGNSVRLRLLQSEVTTFLESGAIEQTTYFGSGEHGALTYGMRHASTVETIQLQHDAGHVVVLLPTQQVAAWARTNQVGMYASLGMGERGILEVVIEKDFACLDLSDEENEDTFPHPQVGATC